MTYWKKGSLGIKWKQNFHVIYWHHCVFQTCVCANRIFVEEGVHDKFVAALSATMNKELKVGDGCNAGVTQGPLINDLAVTKVSSIFLLRLYYC